MYKNYLVQVTGHCKQTSENAFFETFKDARRYFLTALENESPVKTIVLGYPTLCRDDEILDIEVIEKYSRLKEI